MKEVILGKTENMLKEFGFSNEEVLVARKVGFELQEQFQMGNFTQKELDLGATWINVHRILKKQKMGE